MSRARLLLALALLASCGAPFAQPVAIAVTAEPEEIEEPEPEPVADEDLPPDPVGRGDCALTIRLHGIGTRAPVAASIQLWRLGAPGNDDWTAGDQLQLRCDVPLEGTSLHDLPAGRYRIFSGDARRGAHDPPEFTLEDGHSDADLPMDMPRRMSATLLILDERGGQITEATRTDGGSGSSFSSRDDEPDWVVSRNLRRGVACRSVMCGSGCGGGRSRPVAVTATRDGFPVGEFTEASRTSRRSSSHTFRFPGQTDVRLHFANDHPAPWRFVARSVPRGPLWNSVLVEGRPLPANARFEAWTDARDVPGPIKVEVQLDGYEKLEFEWTPGEWLPFRELAPSPASPAPDPSRS